MKGAGSKNAWALFLLILAGVVLGGFIGTLAKGVSALSWLSYGQSFGIDEPIVLDLGVLVITFGLSIKDNHGKYHWRDSFHYHISFLIVYRKVGP